MLLASVHVQQGEGLYPNGLQARQGVKSPRSAVAHLHARNIIHLDQA